ncbi:MAG: Hsp20 family protein [Candidatus Sumerlaeota bacterium]|nr:Hsp20 family protein [Candidatus Sumerlaeota bacterium]
MNMSPITIRWSLCLALLIAMTLCVRAEESFPPVPGSHTTGHTIQKSDLSSHTVAPGDNAGPHSVQQDFEKSLQNAQEQMRKYREEILSQRGQAAGPNPSQPLAGQETILQRMARLDEMIRQMQESMKNTAPSPGASQGAPKDQIPGGIKGTISKGMGGGAAQGHSLSGDTSSQISVFSFHGEPEIKDLGNAYEIRIQAKGLNATNLKVDIEGKMMTIKGSSEEQTETKDSNGVISTTRSSASYSRSFSLPGQVDSAKIKTEYKDGTLIITAPKKKS